VTDRPAAKLQAMPVDRSILWNPSLPGSRPSGGTRAPYPIFFQQEAVIALQEHLKSSPTQAIFGFLIGDLDRDPETGVLYIVIDKTLKLSQPIYGDKTEVVVSRLWDRMQQQLAKAAGTLLGWYHSHPGQGGYLTAHDVETHEKFFTDPWQVAVLVAAEAGGVTGKFFRASQDGDWFKTPLSFYELLQPDSIKPDGKKRSFITWRNHKAFGPSLKGPPPPKPAAAAPPPPPAPAPAPPEREPEEQEEPEEAEEAEEAERAEEETASEPPAPAPPVAERGFRIMRSSADDIPLIRTSADDEPTPAPQPEPPPPPAPPPPPPRKTVAKTRPEEPPKRSSDEIPWQVTPESVAAIPPDVAAPPPPTLAPAAPRRTPTHGFRLLEEEPQRKPVPRVRRRRPRGYWRKRIVLLVLVAGIGAGVYWFVKIRNPAEPLPWAGLVNRVKKLGLIDRAKKLVSRSPAPPPPLAPPRRRSESGTTPPRAAPAPPAPPAPPSPFARFDRLSDSLSVAVRTFQERASEFASGRTDCGGLASGLVTIESLWITYNTERRARMASFDSRRASQDQGLYAAVDSVESRFEQSGCRRP
jgi:proteasome lid subunit RPN8/RPN11